MSPEQIKGERVDARSDLYSVAASLYEFVTGKSPFQGDNIHAIMTAHIKNDPTPPINIQPDLPEVLNDTILRGMATDPGRRFQSAGDFRIALKSVLQVLRDCPDTIYPAITGSCSTADPAFVETEEKTVVSPAGIKSPQPAFVKESPDPPHTQEKPEPHNSAGKPGNGKFTALIVIALILLLAAAGLTIGYFFPRVTNAGKEAGAGKTSEPVLPEEESKIVDFPDANNPPYESRPEEPVIGKAPGAGGAARPADPPAAVKKPEQKENIPPGNPPPPLLPASLLVKTDPGNVYIMLDGMQIGQTGDSGDLSYDGVAPGPHEILARVEGYTEAKQNLQFTSGEQQEAQLKLERLRGRLSVSVNVGNADIRIRGVGVLIDHSDKVTDMELPAGTYTVTAAKTGYRPATETVKVRAHTGNSVSIVLRAANNGRYRER
jgi:hypothetical protein